MKILREIFPKWASDEGIFDLLVEVPWSSASNINSTILNMEYFGNHSGSKLAGSLPSILLAGKDALDDTDRANLANIIIAKYQLSWQKLWAVTNAEYNPVHNYDMTETRTTSGEDNKSGGRDETRNPNLHETTSYGKTQDETDYRFGFNSSATELNPSDKMNVATGGSDEVVTAGEDHTGINFNENSKSSETETLNRSGNIGVTTSQKMVSEERDLWTMWNFFEQVFKDIDKVLALPYYDICKSN